MICGRDKLTLTESEMAKHMDNGITSSEQFVYGVCQKSFLSLWSYANPQGRGRGKELCDVLVVCDPHVIVISVKEVALKDSGKGKVDWDRWQRRTVTASIRQIMGAIRWLNQTDHVMKRDGTPGLPLPPLARRVYHRIAVACGGRRETPIRSPGDKGEGVFHVLDEGSFYLLLRHLDTVSDFIQYLADKEQLLSRTGVIVNGGEENLLAIYLHSGRRFPESANLLVVEDDLWDGVSSKPEFLAKLERDQDSYLWDMCIEALARSVLDGSAYFNPGLSNAEMGLREMAMENRFSRRCLSRSLLEFMNLAQAGKVRSRIAPSFNRRTIYVFMAARLEDDPSRRLNELTARCWVALSEARGRDPNRSVVVGLAVGMLEPGQPLELVYVSIPEWTDEHEKVAEKLRDDFGFFRTPERKQIHEDEYPEKT
jgi:hypothetical protein